MSKEEKELDQAEEFLGINELLKRLDENDKIYEEKLLSEVAIIRELRFQRIQGAQEKRLIKKLISFLLAIIIVGVMILSIISYVAISNKRAITTLNSNFQSTQQSYQRLVDCTTPGHVCYDTSSTNTKNLIAQLIQSISDNNQVQLNTQSKAFQNDLQALLNALRSGQKNIVIPNTNTP